MSQGRMLQRSIVLLTVVSVIALFTAGCDCSKKLEIAQKDNQVLTQRVAELEGQLRQTEAAVVAQSQVAKAQAAVPQLIVKDTIPTAVTAPVDQAPVGNSVYVIKEGDNLWKIARKQLGNGSRYKEILDLNPSITKDKALAVGTKLTLPAK